MRTLLLSLGIAISLLLAPPAPAAQVFVNGWAPGPYGSSSLSGATLAVTYDAAPGEVNDLTISRDGVAHEYLRFTDTEASAVTFGPWPINPCVRGSDPSDLHVVRCPLQGATAKITVNLRDGADRAQLQPNDVPYVSVIERADGGPGDDVIDADSGLLVGGDGDDTLTLSSASLGGLAQGGAGDDRITGSPFGDLLSGGTGDDEISAGAGADSLYDNAPTEPSDAGDDLLDGGDGGDGIYARGGVDQVSGGRGQDVVFAVDGLTAPGSATQGSPDTIDCGDDSDATMIDVVDAVAGCEVAVSSCVGLTTYPWVEPFGPCPRAAAAGSGSGGGGGGGGTAALPAPAASAPAAPSPAAVVPPAPSTAAPAVPAAALSLRVALDLPRVRMPLRMLPRALVRLSATATVTVTLSRERNGRRIGLPGTIERRLGAGEKNISLAALLGGRQAFAPGRYWITVAARSADGRTAARSTALRILAARS